MCSGVKLKRLKAPARSIGARGLGRRYQGVRRYFCLSGNNMSRLPHQRTGVCVLKAENHGSTQAA